jgi:hypothetical protein
MNKLFKFFIFLSIPLMSAMLVGCGEDEPDPEPLVPSITSVSPGEGDPGSVVTITGTNLQDVTAVRFGAMDAEFTADNSTTVTATVPATIEAGTQTITVVAPGGEDTFTFMVTDPRAPTFVSFSPASGSVGDQVSVVGTNLDRITSARLGAVDITDWAAATDGNTATFSVPEGAESGTITLVVDNGDELVSTESFTVVAPGSTIVESRAVVNAQGVRNDEGMVTAFNAQGETFTLAQGAEGNVSEDIDFIAADSGGDNNLDLFSPSHEGWLEGNYFEDSNDQPVNWAVRNQTQMRLLTAGEVDFDNITAEELNAMEIGDSPSLRVSPDKADPPQQSEGAVILFLTAEGQKGLVRLTEHDPNEAAGTKTDIFTFDIKVLE